MATEDSNRGQTRSGAGAHKADSLLSSKCPKKPARASMVTGCAGRRGRHARRYVIPLFEPRRPCARWVPVRVQSQPPRARSCRCAPRGTATRELTDTATVGLEVATGAIVTNGGAVSGAHVTHSRAATRPRCPAPERRARARPRTQGTLSRARAKRAGIMVQRLTYRRRHCYATRSNKIRVVKTPGELVY